VAGGTKRGWTTWLTGAVDKRVTAIVPIVIDVLNVEASMKHHFAAYGFWAPAVGDYVNHKITERTGSRENKALMKIVDPYSYRDRLTMPKFILNGSGDQFFLPDSSQFYYDDLVGEKYLRYVPNADHSLGGSDAVDSVVAFYHSILTDSPRPEYSWTKRNDGSLIVKTKTEPTAVKLWQATNPEARDFRVESIGKVYTSTDLEPLSEGIYVGRVEGPEKGWTAFFIELTYDSKGPKPFKFTTEVSVVPDVLPFADKPLK
jgi:PhoPQ-activated pathogenicity-related protein